MKENRCKPENCPNKCHETSDERRIIIFDHYWLLTPLTVCARQTDT